MSLSTVDYKNYEEWSKAYFDEKGEIPSLYMIKIIHSKNDISYDGCDSIISALSKIEEQYQDDDTELLNWNYKKVSRNKIYEARQQSKGLVKTAVWCPDYSVDELKELMAIICEFHCEKGDMHKELFPAMYREFSTGKMGNKSLNDLQRIEAKGKK